MKPSICMVGQFPPPVHGLSKALETICRSRLQERYELQRVDITNNRAILRSIRQLRESRCDCYYFTIAQSCGGNLRDLMLLRLMLGKGKPVIVHLHGGNYRNLYRQLGRMQQRLNRRYLGRVDLAIVLGESLRDQFAEVVDDTRVRVVENFVEAESLIDDEAFERKLASLEHDELRVLYLSNFMPSKGYLELLEAARRLRDSEVQGVRFTFAGLFYDERARREFEAEVADEALAGYVEYRGAVYGPEKLQLLAESHLFVLPTWYAVEGQPISMIEAMGNGLGVVTTRQGGIPDLVNETNGWIVAPRSPGQLAERLAEIVQERGQLRDYARANRRKILAGFLEADYIARMEAIFREALAGAGRS